MPSGNLIDISVNMDGGNCLVDNSGSKSVFYVGSSNHWDIGVN